MRMKLKDPSWEGMEDWWRRELASDPAYEDDVTPMAFALLEFEGRVLDVGCGEGRLMRALTPQADSVFGIDLLPGLLASAREHGDVVCGKLPNLSMFRNDVFDSAVVCLVLEHIEDHTVLLSELARVVRSGGELALIANHPYFTAPGSAPIQDGDELLWRPGDYLSRGHTDEPMDDGHVRFHHRPLGTLMSDASRVGWDLDRLLERGATDSQVARHPMLSHQRGIPRLLGCRWVRR